MPEYTQFISTAFKIHIRYTTSMKIYKNILLGLAFFLLPLSLIYAQGGSVGIPTTYTVYDVSGNGVQTGDIVSYNKDLKVYEQSHTVGDTRIFGVVNESPVLVFRTGSGFPIIQTGEVLVNVTTEGGSIEIGDDITTSDIPGMGQKFNDTNGFILGTALEPFYSDSSTTTIIFDGNEVVYGSILTLLSIGSSVDDSEKPVAPATIFIHEGGENETGLETVFRYITAALFTVGTLFIVVRTFGPNLAKGVVSIGRNPLAKTSIQAMVIFNVILILSISAISFIVSLLIIFLPL